MNIKFVISSYFIYSIVFLLIIDIAKTSSYYPLVFYNYNYTKLKSQKDDLILTFALNYNFSQIRNFILSLNFTEYRGSIVMFTYHLSHFYKHLLNSYNVKVIELNRTYPFYPCNDKYYPINVKEVIKYLYYYQGKSFVTYRYFIYRMFIRFYGRYYKYILITDIRDVIFQLNPFEWNMKKGVYLIEEHPKRQICSDKSNLMYVKYYKPRKIILKTTIINGGILYGSYPELLSFLTDFLKFICSFHCNANDQGGINIFARNYKYFPYPLYILNASHTPVKTMALWLFDSIKCCLPINNVILNKDSSIPHIIHQYDRAIKYNYNNNITLNLYKSYLNFYTNYHILI